MNRNNCCINNHFHKKLANIVEFLKTISEENRLKILCILLKQGEKCVCEIYEYLALSQNLTSHHLKVLKEFGLLKARKDGLNVFYSVDYKFMTNHKKLLDCILTKNTTTNKDAKEIIKKAYGKVATNGGAVCPMGGCCGGGAKLSQEIGYTKEDIDSLADANLGLGCGNSVNLGEIRKGETILDLGSGAGLDCFLAARKVGEQGKVIGVDMTQAMIDKARKNAQKYKFNNVEFRLGDIENLPIEDASIDTIMSNCVINLAPNKDKVFKEAFRVLKPGGKMAISDVVLTGNLTTKQKNDASLLSACVSGAILKDEYLSLLEKIGFIVTIIEEDKEISKKWFGKKELPISSLKFIALKK